jgi:hypothetical protein
MTEAHKSFSTTEISQTPRVSFEDHVVVVPIVSLKTFPSHVRSSLWMSRDELAFSMRQAKRLELKERRQKAIEALQETYAETKGEIHMLSTGDDEADEDNEASMDFLDLALSADIDAENLGLDNVLEAMHDITLSQQVC